MVLQLILRHVKINVRSIQTKAVKEKPKFTSTINLPKTKFPPRLAPNLRTEVEDKLRKVSTDQMNNFKLRLQNDMNYLIIFRDI